VVARVASQAAAVSRSRVKVVSRINANNYLLVGPPAGPRFFDERNSRPHGSLAFPWGRYWRARFTSSFA
jgi:hypothetical protein